MQITTTVHSYFLTICNHLF